jgi:hypothetical protein
MSAVKVTLTGLNAFRKNLRYLRSAPAQRRIVLPSLEAAARPVLARARTLAPPRSDQPLRPHREKHLRDALGLATPANQRVGSAYVLVTATEFTAQFIEYGYYATGPGGSASPTWVPPRPFMRPALSQKRRSAVNIFARTMSRRVETDMKGRAK